MVTTPQTVISAYSQAMTLLFQGSRLSALIPKNLQEAVDCRESLASLNQAMQRFTCQLPREATVDEIKRMEPPYAFGAECAHLAFFGLLQVRCIAYVIIIHMHQAAEHLQELEQGPRARVCVDMEKKLAAAHEATSIAEQIFNELSKPGCNLNAKDGVCILMGYMWSFIASVYAKHIAKIRETLPIMMANTELQLCSDNMFKLISALRRLAQVFPVLDLQVQKMESLIEGTTGNL